MWGTGKEGNVLFNDALNTFYLQLYGIRHMVKVYSDSEKGNLLLPHRLLFPISGIYMHHPTDRITHTMAFVTSVVEHWLEWEIAQWVHPMKDRSDDPSHYEWTPLPQSYISLPREEQKQLFCPCGNCFLWECIINCSSSHKTICNSRQVALAWRKNSPMGLHFENNDSACVTIIAN